MAAKKADRSGKKKKKVSTGSKNRAKRGSASIKSSLDQPVTESTKTYCYVSQKLGYLFLAVLCILLYVNSLGGGMVNWDDSIITGAWDKELSFELVKNEFLDFHGTYQPLRNLSHVLDHEIFGQRLWGYRLHSILLYTANVLLAYGFLLFLLRRYPLIRGFGNMSDHESSRPQPVVIPPETAALIIAALFAAHPVHVEAVSWISARKEVLFGLFYFLSVLLYVKKEEWKGSKAFLGYAGSFVCYVMALLSKPAAASLPFVILAYDLIMLRPQAKAWKIRIFHHLPFWLPFVGALIYFVGKAGTTETPWATLNLYERILTSQKAAIKYLEILFYPVRLSARYFVDPARSLADPAVFVGVLFNAGMLGIFIRCLRRNPFISFALAWIYLNWLPTSGLVPLSIKVADRYIYLSALGFCVLVFVMIVKMGMWLSTSEEGRRKAAAYVAVPILIAAVAALSVGTISRNRVWKEERLLWEDMARKTPTDLAMNHMAQYYMIRDRWKEAEFYIRKSLGLNPLQDKEWNNLGNVLVLQKRPKEAEGAFKKALSLNPQLREVLKNMAMACAMQQKYGQAEKYLVSFLSDNPKDYKAWDLLAQVLLAQKRYREVVKASRRMASLRPKEAKPYIFMAKSFDLMGEKKKAKWAYQKALQRDPQVTKAYFKNPLSE